MMNFVALCALMGMLGFVKESDGHGMMLDPINRSSAWRYFPGLPVNYDDNQVYCGGFGTQHIVHCGKCGLCGDSFGDSSPRDNENTGKYGTGMIMATYNSGSTIDIYVKLITNHKGYFEYSLCPLTNSNAPESNESCFIPLELSNGDVKRQIPSGLFEIRDQVVLPAGLTCEHCSLRWQYVTGNHIGLCENATIATGCGPQETYRNCADITIN